MSEMLEVTQADREAAANYLFAYATDAERLSDGWLGRSLRWLLSGHNDTEKTIQAFARHRIAARFARDEMHNNQIATDMVTVPSEATDVMRQIGAGFMTGKPEKVLQSLAGRIYRAMIAAAPGESA